MWPIPIVCPLRPYINVAISESVSTWLKPLDIHITELLKIYYADQQKQWQDNSTHVLFRDTVQFACCLEARLWVCHVMSKTVWHPGDIFSESTCSLPNLGKAVVIKRISGTRLTRDRHNPEILVVRSLNYSILTSFDLAPRCICLATEAMLLTFTCTRSASRNFESTKRLLALVLDADAIFH
jgi:hypothetical protein